MRVLLIGATGALGKAVLARLQNSPDDFSVFAPSRRDPTQPLDLSRCDQIADAVHRFEPDLILNLAATFSEDFQEAYSINVAATRLLLDAVERSGRAVRVLLIGSAAEYGAVTPDENPVKESRILRPVSVYGISKAWQTELAYLYASRGVDVVVGRVFNLIGPHISERLFIGRIAKQISQIRQGCRTQIEVGALTASRDYIHVDQAAVQLLAIARFGVAGNVYNVASGRAITMREVLLNELERAGIEQSLVAETSTPPKRFNYDVPVIFGDISKVNCLLKSAG
jgi:nucleoside-diphosphate-sugar epimerase